MAGTLTVPSFVFGARVIASSDGAFHVVYRTQTPETVVYGRCASDCGVTQKWVFAVIEANSGFVGNPRIAIDAAKKVHVVYRVNSLAKEIYATCTTDCTTASNWTKTQLGSSPACDWHGEDSNLAIDDQGRLSFLTTDFNTEKICLNTCGSGCGNAANWQFGVVATAAPSSRRTQFDFAVSGSTLHLIYDDLAAGLVYQRCTSNCTQTANWQVSSPLFYHVGTPVALAATPSGRLAMAFNQGVTDASAPSGVKANDDRLELWECTGDCTLRASWNGVAVGDLDDGKNGVAVIASGTGTLAIGTRSTTRAFICESNCGVGGSWKLGDVETQATLLAALPDPYTPNCSSGPPLMASWAPEHPSVAASSVGTLVFTMTKGLRTCAGSAVTVLPGYGRLLYAPP